MIYFFCVLLFFAVMCGKAKGVSGIIGLIILDVALVFAILRIGGYV